MRHLAVANSEASADLKSVERVEFNDRVIAVLARKDIVEALSQSSHGFSDSIAGDRTTATVAKRSQVIDPVHMVSVVMGPEHGINAVYPVGQELLAEISGSIDQDSLACTAFHDNGCPGPAVPGLSRITLTPVIADPRHPG